MTMNSVLYNDSQTQNKHG